MLIRVLFVVLPLITTFQLNSILLALLLAFYFAQHFLIRPFHKRTSYNSVCKQKSGWKVKLTSVISHFSQPKISDGNFLLHIIAFGSVIGNSELTSTVLQVVCVFLISATILQMGCVVCYYCTNFPLNILKCLRNMKCQDYLRRKPINPTYNCGMAVGRELESQERLQDTSSGNKGIFQEKGNK